MQASREPSQQSADWRLVLLVVFVAHCAASVLIRLVPVLAPELILHHGWSAERVGLVASIANIGSVGFVMVGAGLFSAIGSARGVLLGVVSGLVGLAALAVPTMGFALLAGLLLGFAHAPSHPVGNDLLQSHAPKGFRSLIFSVKLSAPSLGGVLAGMLLPSVALQFGLQAALCVAAIPLLTTLLVLIPLYRRLPPPDPDAPKGLAMFNLRSLSGPLVTVLSDARIRPIVFAGFFLSLVHSAWLVYLPSYLSIELSLLPVVAGGIYAVMQTGSFIGRIVIGWCADRFVSPRTVLIGAMIGTATTTCLLPLVASTENPLYIGTLALVTGIVASGWNGVQVAETMRLAGPNRMINVASGAMVMTGSGVILGPMVLSVLVEVLGSWNNAYIALMVLPVTGLGIFLLHRH